MAMQLWTPMRMFVAMTSEVKRLFQESGGLNMWGEGEVGTERGAGSDQLLLGLRCLRVDVEKFSSGTCLFFHLPFGCEFRMRRIVFSGVFLLICLLNGILSTSPPTTAVQKDEVKSVICRACNLSLPFHGCLLDFGTCKTKPGQFCIQEIHTKLGIQWYSVKSCTMNHSECFRRIVTTYEVHSTHCCHKPFCNF
ncbi:PREDICTED: LOW QUALITY PROTEIN: uncharacterized protein C9orf57 homolog [Elephantulus edwardii]|uniref:LOW QUALITY PROTEIN: uncharacterized protein C9orf57 homolog n=1 Tax=Elephantulus edwardii TaxID=28737 RepID=UPI0003F0774F|nr:PREDICTED: LOW QUALITY PROTEIN: uncharacterized protein C9orf57 homolog [Elephantulus edwardii]